MKTRAENFTNDCGGNPCATCGRSVRVEYNGARRVAGLGGFLKRCPKARAQLEACNRIFNDCGGTEGTGESRPDKSVPEGHKADFPPGPQSPFPSPCEDTEVVGWASDDFGLLRALPLAIPASLTLWAVIAATWIALL